MTEPPPNAEGFASAASIPPMPSPAEFFHPASMVHEWPAHVAALESWGRDLASRLEAAQAVVEALNPGEEDPLTVVRRLKRERVELGTAINRLAQALGWPSITPDRPFAEQTVDVALERLALAGELAEALVAAYGYTTAATDLLPERIKMLLAKFRAAQSNNPQA